MAASASKSPPSPPTRTARSRSARAGTPRTPKGRCLCSALGTGVPSQDGSRPGRSGWPKRRVPGTGEVQEGVLVPGSVRLPGPGRFPAGAAGRAVSAGPGGNSAYRQGRRGIRVPGEACSLPHPRGTNPQTRMPRASAAPRAPSTVTCTGFACTFHRHPYGQYLNMFLN